MSVLRRVLRLHSTTAAIERNEVNAAVAHGDRVAWRSRLAGIGVVAILLGVSAFGILTSESSADSVSSAVAASDFSDEYTRAAAALASEESLERKYRLEPSAAVRAGFNVQATRLAAALSDVRTD